MSSADKAKPIFTEQDRELIEGLVFDPSLRPEFNAVSTCLYWDDEMPPSVSYAGMTKVRTLWMARGYLHRGLTLADHFLNPESLCRFWEQAIEEVPGWPGFKRLELSQRDKEYLDGWLADKSPFD